MKNIIRVFILSILVLINPEIIAAGTQSFLIQTTVPTAAGFSLRSASVKAAADTSISVSSVSYPEGAWTPLSGSATVLSFDPLSYNATYNYWAPSHYFSVDIGGTGSVTTVVTYIEGTNPNSSTGRNGLGHKAIATFIKAVYPSGETIIPAHGKKKLIDLKSVTISPSQISGGWLRVYLGIATDPSVVTGSELFTNNDSPGTYTGTLTFTATLS